MLPQVRVLCVCSGNTCRSPMVQVLVARALEKAGIYGSVESAGISAMRGEPASAMATAAMARRNLDLSKHQSRPVVDLDLSLFAHFLTVGPRHAVYVQNLGGISAERTYVIAGQRGGIMDPYGGSEEEYEACAKELEAELPAMLKFITG